MSIITINKTTTIAIPTYNTGNEDEGAVGVVKEGGAVVVVEEEISTKFRVVFSPCFPK